MNTHKYRSRNLRNTLMLLGLAVASMVALAIGGRNAERFTCDTTPHKVFAYDTLWSIAEKKCDGNIQVVTDKLVAVYGTVIQSGDNIYLPTNQDCSLKIANNGNIYEEC